MSRKPGRYTPPSRPRKASKPNIVERGKAIAIMRETRLDLEAEEATTVPPLPWDEIGDPPEGSKPCEPVTCEPVP